MRIAIIRHGESVDDIEDSYGGIADFELTDHGRKQAAALGKALAGEGIECLYSSPLRRAKETATIVANMLGGAVPVVEIGGLHERNSYGVLSGVSKARAAQLFARELAELKEKPGYSREPLLGAEDFDDFVQRVKRAFEVVCERASGDSLRSIGIVTHGKFTQALFEFVFGLGGEYQPDHGVATFVEHEPSVSRVVGKASPESLTT